MLYNNKDQTDWIIQHCEACTPTKQDCRDQHRVLMGTKECWTGKGINKVFCPYHPLSNQRYETMKKLQRDLQGPLSPYFNEPSEDCDK